MNIYFVFGCVAYAAAFSVSHPIMTESVCKVITCRSPLLTFGNIQNLLIHCEDENLNRPGNILEILIKFIINPSQYCSTYSEVPPSSVTAIEQCHSDFLFM